MRRQGTVRARTRRKRSLEGLGNLGFLPLLGPVGAAALATLFTFQVLKPSKAQARLLGSSYDEAVNALSRMLWAETRLNQDEEEMAQIVHVALNRARKWGLPVSYVVSPDNNTRGKVWSTGEGYRNSFSAAPSQASWNRVRAFVKRVLDNEYRNSGFVRFVHPGRMPNPPCASNRIEADTFAGRKCIPPDNAPGVRVGNGLFA